LYVYFYFAFFFFKVIYTLTIYTRILVCVSILREVFSVLVSSIWIVYNRYRYGMIVLDTKTNNFNSV